MLFVGSYAKIAGDRGVSFQAALALLAVAAARPGPAGRLSGFWLMGREVALALGRAESKLFHMVSGERYRGWSSSQMMRD